MFLVANFEPVIISWIVTNEIEHIHKKTKLGIPNKKNFERAATNCVKATTFIALNYTIPSIQ